MNGKLVNHSFEGFFPSYMLFIRFAYTHYVLWLELTEETNLPNSLVPLLNVRCKRDNLWKILHSQAEIYDYNGIKFRASTSNYITQLKDQQLMKKLQENKQEKGKNDTRCQKVAFWNHLSNCSSKNPCFGNFFASLSTLNSFHFLNHDNFYYGVTQEYANIWSSLVSISGSEFMSYCT